MWPSKQARRASPARSKLARARLTVESLEARSMPALLAPISSPDPLPFATVGDFNNDGNADLVGAGTGALGGPSVVVRLGNGDGTLQPRLTSPTASGLLGFGRIEVGDFNDDGNLDLVVATAMNVNVQLGNGDGTFQPPNLLVSIQNPIVAAPLPFAVGDINGDGHLDLLPETYFAYGGGYGWTSLAYVIHPLLSNGDGTFTALPAMFGGGNRLFLNDFNGDAMLDLLVPSSSFGSQHSMLRLGNGDGTFQNSVTASSDYAAWAVTDFDGDGQLDFAGIKPDWMTGNSLVRAFLGNGDGTFHAGPQDLPGVSFADFNSDGFADHYGASSTGGTVSIRLGSGDATFQAEQTFAAGPGATAPIAADLNGDGLLDIIMQTTDGFAVLLNDGDWDGPPPPPPPPPPSPPTLSIGDAPIAERNTGSVAAEFMVTLSAPSTEPITVAFATANGTATAGGDYATASGTLTFVPGETNKTVTVLVNGDRLGEPNETFFVNLSAATNAVIADGQGEGTIFDDEPRISISDVTKAEGRKGKTTLFTFTITLSAAYDEPVTMSFRTADGTAKTSNNDYISKTGTLTFNPDETTKTITIKVKGDNKREADETFYLDLFGLSGNARFTKSRGLGTIRNDD